MEQVQDQMKMSREHALLGNYEASLVYFDGVVAQIKQHLRTVDDPHLRAQWERAKEDLVAEFRIVKEITQELARFKDKPGSAALTRGDASWEEVPAVAPYVEAAEDLDVWPEPPPQPERRAPPPRRVSTGGEPSNQWGRPPAVPASRAAVPAASARVPPGRARPPAAAAPARPDAGARGVGQEYRRADAPRRDGAPPGGGRRGEGRKPAVLQLAVEPAIMEKITGGGTENGGNTSAAGGEGEEGEEDDAGYAPANWMSVRFDAGTAKDDVGLAEREILTYSGQWQLRWRVVKALKAWEELDDDVEGEKMHDPFYGVATNVGGTVMRHVTVKDDVDVVALGDELVKSLRF